MANKVRVGINGFGRMGRLSFRELFDAGQVDIVRVNEVKGGVRCAAHLLEFDSVQGRWDRNICVQEADNTFTVDGKLVRFSEHPLPEDIPWGGGNGDDGGEGAVAIVLECSGKFVASTDALEGHFKAWRGVRKVLVSAPVKKAGQRGDALNIAYGCNQGDYDAQKNDIVTAASCTTNCLAPVVKALHETLGIERGCFTTIHDVTNTQVVVDAPHRDLRRARACLTSLVPTSSGSASAIVKIFPDLAGKLNGMAVRVPLLTGSLTDLVFVPKRDTTAEEINAILKRYAQGELKGILDFEERPLVSSDFCGNRHSGIVDGLSTMAVDSKLFKVLIWYDNERGYAARMADICHMLADRL
jgi:glyceraldehyde 3-phosphate dehydrogenase